MTQTIFDKFEIGDLVKHTRNEGPYTDPTYTYGIVTAIRTHETQILPERRVEITIRFNNPYNSVVHYNWNNELHLIQHVELIARAKQ